MNIAHILTEQAAIRPDAPAIIERRHGRNRVTSFREMERASCRAATLLLSAGLRPGDRALVLQPMSSELYTAMIALFRLGLIAIFLDPSAGRGHIADCCSIAPPRALICSAKAQLLYMLPEIRRIHSKFVIGPALPGSIPWSRADRLDPVEMLHACDHSTPALITFTSGATGRPKAAMRTHSFLLAQHAAIERTIGLPAGTVDMATLPVFTLANLAAGLTSVIPDADIRSPGTVDPKPILAQIDSCRPTRIGASPAFLERIAEQCLAQSRGIPSVREIFTGGGPVFPRLFDKLRLIAPEAKLAAIYGSTEAEPIAEITLDDIAAEDRAAMSSGHGLLAGMPVSAIELRIIRDRCGLPAPNCSEPEFAAESMPVDSPGEIVVSGKHVLTGYLNGEGDSETKIRVDGTVWHRTGDTGYLDSSGRLWLLGRCSAVVSDDRGVLYPFAVECAAQNWPHVRRAALLSRSGERMLAVEAEPNAVIDVDGLQVALSWAQLERVIVVKRIPVDRRHNAKVDYVALDAML